MWLDCAKLERSLKTFPKESDGMYIVYDLFTFDNFFRLLLKEGLDHDEALDFAVFNFSMSVLVWQERIHNKRYLRRLSAEQAIHPLEASRKARLIYDFMEIIRRERRGPGKPK